MRIYLAGSIPKGDHEAATFRDWRVEYAAALRSLHPSVEIADPNVPVDESDPLCVAGMCCHLIRESDAVVVCAESKLGPGTSQEMLVAKYYGKPVVTVLPRDSAHRKSDTVFHGQLVRDWIHPFVSASSDAVVESVGEIALHHLRPESVK